MKFSDIFVNQLYVLSASLKKIGAQEAMLRPWFWEAYFVPEENAKVALLISAPKLQNCTECICIAACKPNANERFVHPVARLAQNWTAGQTTPVRVTPGSKCAPLLG